GIEVENNGSIAAYLKLNNAGTWSIKNVGDTGDDGIVTAARVDRTDISVNELKTRLTPYAYNSGTTSIDQNVTLGNTSSLVTVFADVSMNRRLFVGGDASMGANLFVGGSIVNTNLTNAINLKANAANPSFTGNLVSDGDSSLNSQLN
ncbi:MAG: hypothetical protein ACLBM3_00900, partial [Dolichospermum sp.]